MGMGAGVHFLGDDGGDEQGVLQDGQPGAAMASEGHGSGFRHLDGGAKVWPCRARMRSRSDFPAPKVIATRPWAEASWGCRYGRFGVRPDAG